MKHFLKFATIVLIVMIGAAALLPSGLAQAGPLHKTPGSQPHPILGDLRVRQAIAYCTNKEALLATARPEVPADQRAS